MESCRVTHLLVSSVGPDSQHESELIPTTVIVRLIDAHVACEQADDKWDRGDDPVPEPDTNRSALTKRRPDPSSLGCGQKKTLIAICAMRGSAACPARNVPNELLLILSKDVMLSVLLTVPVLTPSGAKFG
jgi:hypothetical protein